MTAFLSHIPVGKWCQNDVIKSHRRLYDVILKSIARWGAFLAVGRNLGFSGCDFYVYFYLNLLLTCLISHIKFNKQRITVSKPICLQFQIVSFVRLSYIYFFGCLSNLSDHDYLYFRGCFINYGLIPHCEILLNMIQS